MRVPVAVLALAMPGVCLGQWSKVEVPTSANLLSVQAVGDAVWVSGAKGTVLLSADRGTTWTKCATPPGADGVDLRAVHGFDATTAVVMTGGKGEHARLLRTTDGCKSWTKVFANPNETGAFDSLKRVSSRQMYALAEPVGGKFVVYLSRDSGATWFETDDPGLEAEKGETAAGSTTTQQGSFLYFGTAGGAKPYVHFTYAKCNPATPDAECAIVWGRSAAGDMGGVRGVAVRSQTSMSGKSSEELVAVGAAEGGTAAFAAYSRGGPAWMAAETLPAGPKAAVAFDGATQTWLAVGVGGTDVSVDGGKHWSRVKAVASSSAPDTGWTALSLPFAVGANGMVGMLDRAALKR